MVYVDAGFVLNSLTDGMVVSHLPDGPTAHFKISNVRLTTEIKVTSVYNS